MDTERWGCSWLLRKGLDLQNIRRNIKAHKEAGLQKTIKATRVQTNLKLIDRASELFFI